MIRTFKHIKKGYIVRVHVTKKRPQIEDDKGFVCISHGATQEVNNFFENYKEIK